MNKFKTYRLRRPFTIKARPVEPDEIIYDSFGRQLDHRPDDYLVIANGDRKLISAIMLDALYEEVTDGTASEEQDVPPTVDPELGGR